MSSIAGRTVVITGGGSGAGAALALAFAEAGARVWICGRNEARLHETAAQHPAITGRVADVTDEPSVQALFAGCGPVHIVIANAGAAASAAFARTRIEDWRALLEVNLTGVFLTLREGLRQMPEGYGRLIAVASTAGLRGYAYAAAYAASKHGVIGLVRSLALEIAATAVTVNAICPGFMDTPMTEQTVARIMDRTAMSAAEARAALIRDNPQGRLIAPQAVADTALWLCGEGAASVHGQAIAISGGAA